MINKNVSIKLNNQQIQLLRGVIYEYYSTHNYMDKNESYLHNQLETILTKAENSTT
jgi:hypothetical protein